MTNLLNRHRSEIVIILAELFIAAFLLLRLPFVVETVTVCVGLLAMLCGACCVRNYCRTTPAYARYDPELRRGVCLLLAGAMIATMRLWFSVTVTAPWAALGLALLTIAAFKTAVLCDARGYRGHSLLFPALSALLSFGLGLLVLLAPLVLVSLRFLFIGLLLVFAPLIDTLEICASEAEHREPWSVQIRCWM